jgi:uncharacterized membrane protein YeaQ/YmgE (transglycosylase-associated protein family)
MNLLAELTLHPGGILAWIGVGLIAGWLAGLVTSGGGFGILGDLVLGLVGAVVGGLVAGFFIEGDAGFWASIVISVIGACMVIAVARILMPRRARRT